MSSRFRSLFLCYHAVSSEWKHPLSTEVGDLEVFVRSLLRRGYRPASAEEALRSSDRLLHVTFDDAYRNLVEAVPALTGLGVPVTIFACTRYAEAGSVPDMPELAQEVAMNGDLLATMDWAALRELAREGAAIGSHTITHPHLPELSDRDLREELVASRERVEAELGMPCRYLAYPYGEEDPRVRAAARTAGYDAAFALEQGVGALDRYAVPRLVINRQDTLFRATLKTSMPVRRTVQAVKRQLRRP